MKLGELLADMVLYGDIEEAPPPANWEAPRFLHNDEEGRTRLAIAQTFLAMMNDMPRGSCCMNDRLLQPMLKLEVPEGHKHHWVVETDSQNILNELSPTGEPDTVHTVIATCKCGKRIDGDEIARLLNE